MNNAKFKTVLVTRPVGQADSLNLCLTNNGYKVINIPMVVIEPINDLKKIEPTIKNLNQYDHVVVVSSNAARLGLQWVNKYLSDIPPHLSWHAIGAATAVVLQQKNLTVNYPDNQATSEGLLSSSYFTHLKSHKILIWSGHGGRELLAQELTNRGAKVDLLELYQRKKPNLSQYQIEINQLEQAVADDTMGGIVITSGEILANLLISLAKMRDKLIRLQIIVPSQRVAELAKESGFSHVVVAKGASDQAILDELQSH